MTSAEIALLAASDAVLDEQFPDCADRDCRPTRQILDTGRGKRLPRLTSSDVAMLIADGWAIAPTPAPSNAEAKP